MKLNLLNTRTSFLIISTDIQPVKLYMKSFKKLETLNLLIAMRALIKYRVVSLSDVSASLSKFPNNVVIGKACNVIH